MNRTLIRLESTAILCLAICGCNAGTGSVADPTVSRPDSSLALPIAPATGATTQITGVAEGVSPAAVVSPTNQTTKSEVRMTNQFSVTENNQKELLSIARQSIEYYLKNGKEQTFKTSDPELTAPAAVFVTLTQKGQLRGCIGTTAPREPLFEAVSQLAVAAAVNDNRFQPLTIEELGRTHIEISVLSPMTRVKSADEIKPGIHGVVVRSGFNSGLFLPQVWEHFSNKEDFMNELCWQKAHLKPEAWKDPKTELQIFTVFAFEEKK